MIDVILPVLNESAAIPWVLGRMPSFFRPVLVDNGSSDGSGDMAKSLGAQVIREPQLGFGAACFAGLMAATSDVVCFMDCDGSLDPLDLPLVAEPVIAGDADLSLGARLAAPRAWPVHARMANRGLAWRAGRRAGVRLSDLGPMRAARRTELIALDVHDRRSGWPLEMVLKAIEAGWRMGEVPVTYRPRLGRSKVTGTVAGTLQAVADMASVMRSVPATR